MAYSLESMLKIRRLREDRAQTALAVARQARDAAVRTLEERREKRRTYDATKEPRRDKAYETVLGRVVSRQDLDLVRETVTQIDEESQLLHRAEAAADAERRTREDEAEAAHGVFTVAAKERTKISEHRRMWDEEDRRHREALSDAEMEEFSGRKLVADDDDTFD